MPELSLPTTRVYRSFVAAMAEFRMEGRGSPDDGSMIGSELRELEHHWSTPESFAGYVDWVRSQVLEDSPRPEGHVRSTTLWWVKNDELLGRLAIRHRLTPHPASTCPIVGSVEVGFGDAGRLQRIPLRVCGRAASVRDTVVVQIVEHSVIGTRSAVLRLRRPGTELQFVVFPMFHVASPQFYAEVSERLRRCDLLVVEGVSGRSALGWAITSTYRIIPANKRSGLVADNIPYGSLGVPVIHPDVTAGEFAQSWRRLPLRTRLLMWLVMPIVAVLQLFGGRRRLLGPEVELEDLPTDLDDHELGGQLHGVFGGARDERLLAALCEIHRDRAAERIDVAIVYGAAHTAAIVHGLLRRHGYRPRSGEWLTVVAPAQRPARSMPASASAPKLNRAPEPEPEPVRPEAADAHAQLVRVAMARRMAAAEPEAYQPKLAAALDALARRLSDLGRREEALRAADEAVDVYEELEERHPARTAPRWG